jgi:hypothetical protein
VLAEGFHGTLPPQWPDRQVEHDDVGPPGGQVLPRFLGRTAHDDCQPRLARPPRDEQVVQEAVRDDEHLDRTHDPKLWTARAAVVLNMEEKRSATWIGIVP